MIDFEGYTWLDEYPAWAETAAKLLWSALGEPSLREFLDVALPLVREAAGAEYAALVRAERGRWQTLASSGGKRPLPADLLSEALDLEQGVGREPWFAAPLEPRRGRGELLVVHGAWDSQAEAGGAVTVLTHLLLVSLKAVRGGERDRRRIRRLEAILEIAAQWRQTQQMGPLLTRMAEASTRLLEAERASIFLWDRASHTLVGRPALGVEGGELRIADDRGVVGQVVQTGQPRRVDAEDDSRDIDRRVDEQLGFRTRTLVCVPLRGRNGEMFGAFEVINKREGSFSDEDQAALTELATHAAVALESTQEYEQLLRTRNQMADQAAQSVQLIGECPAVEALRSTVQRVANTDLAVLLLGNNGTGKEVVSQQIHYLSSRRNEPFVAVNCAALTETLLESELFGHEKGAFTDAHESRPGKFELASGGTLFLDEIGDMSLGGQAKLLRVLEEKVVVRVGGSKSIHTDARVIAATNQNLAQMVRERRFREDLYFRLNVVTIELPPLRERGDDILLLAEHFLNEFSAKARRTPPRFTAAARRRLLQHNWPGNVRELRNLMERLAYLVPEDRIDADDLAFILSPTSSSPGMVSLQLPLNEATRRFQTEYIKKHIEQAGDNMSEAARRLGLHRSNLYRKMRQLEMPVEGEEE